jgi:hypothetical protein
VVGFGGSLLSLPFAVAPPDQGGRGIANGAIVPGLTPHTERRHRAALDQRPEKPLLFEGVFRAQHRDLSIVWEVDGDRLFGHERTAARERCTQAMHCTAETFQQGSLVFRTAGGCHDLRRLSFSLLLYREC